MNLPNALTITRIFLMPLLVIVLLTKFEGRHILGVPEEIVGAGIFGLASLTDWLDGVVDRDERGFVIAGPDLSAEGDRPRGWELDRAPYHLETSVPGVFVAGDARAKSAKRVASAVGEGAMAVMLVHRYLEKL